MTSHHDVFFLRLFLAARHPAGVDMCPSAGAHGTGHVIFDAMVSVPRRVGTAMQRAVLASCELVLSRSSWLLFCDLLSTELSFFLSCLL